jgi:predicted outer membrane repeat protein
MAEINISNLGGGGGTLTLTTTGTGGASTYVAGVLNIPVYQSALTNPVTGTGTATRVAFWDSASSVSSSANLYWDNSNSFLGVGTATPGARLQVNGSGLTSGTTAFSVKDSGGTDSFTVADNGNTSVRGVLTISGSSASNSATLMGRTVSGEVASVTLGTNLSFSGNTLNATGGGTPAGSTGQIQVNTSGAFSASADFTFESNKLSVGTSSGGGLIYNRGATRFTNNTGLNLGGGIYMSFPTTGGDAFVMYAGNSSTATMYWNSGGLISTAGSAFIGNPSVGTAPSARLQVRGSFATGGTNAFLIQNSTPSTLFQVQNDGATTLNGTLAQNGTVTMSDGSNIAVGSTNGTKIGTATNQKIGFYNKTPLGQPSPGTEAAFVENAGGTAVNEDSTFGGYTLQQVVQALQNLGLLA